MVLTVMMSAVLVGSNVGVFVGSDVSVLVGNGVSVFVGSDVSVLVGNGVSVSGGQRRFCARWQWCFRIRWQRRRAVSVGSGVDVARQRRSGSVGSGVDVAVGQRRSRYLLAAVLMLQSVTG